MRRLYLDASAIIYLAEGHDLFGASTERRVLQHISSDQQAKLLTSRLSWLECRVRPLRDGNSRLLEYYDDFFAGERLVLADVANNIIERATELRARYRFKTPDALHLATAIEHGADAVLTGDPAWRRCSEEVKVEVIEADQ